MRIALGGIDGRGNSLTTHQIICLLLRHLIAQDGSWSMLRGSGTEPNLRIYAEAKLESDAEKPLKIGTNLTRQV